ncbi:MAG TPA: beta-ketoacyl synthase chain length factor [Burkholderiales bacterium]|jgi:hypothetical protein|nr:beta-ketoacyl synthase chain length factor [Burkholderiales bacterium]
MTRVYVEGVGLLGPGLQGWAAGAPVLAATADYVSAPTVVPVSQLLPAAERRRAGLPVKLVLAVGEEAFANAGRDPGATATVFTSSSGDGETLHKMCEGLAGEDRQISPTRFHNSVHNAPAGYWSIAVGAREASTSLCGHDASFAVALIDAYAQVVAENTAVALIACDQPYPEPMNGVRPIAASVAIGVVLTPQPTPRSLAALQITLADADGGETAMHDAQLETLRLGVPAARALPLLAAIARGGASTVEIGYTGALKLVAAVGPC